MKCSRVTNYVTNFIFTSTCILTVVSSSSIENVNNKPSNIGKVGSTEVSLENEKQEVFKQIHIAIDDSIKALREINDNETINNIQVVSELKKLLSSLNTSSNDDLQFVTPNSSETLDTRRRFIYRKKDIKDQEDEEDDKNDKDEKNGKNKKDDKDDKDEKDEESEEGEEDEDVKMALPVTTTPNNNQTRKPRRVRKKADNYKLFKDKVYDNRNKGKKQMERYISRLKMQKRIEEWIAAKAAEKNAIKKYKNNSLFSGKEKCPRFGIKKSKSKGGKGKKKFKGYYPCCRKCCKASYLGCL